MALALVASGQALASRAMLNFSVTGFESDAPESVVSGLIELELNETSGEVLSIVSVSLSINGHAFEASELGFDEYRNFNIVGARGANLGSATGISHGSPFDFWILWNKDSGLPKEFAYTGAVEAIHVSKRFTSFSIEPVE